MKTHPHISVLHTLYLSENQPFRKVHRMIDLFESIIKMHTVVIMAEYVRHNKLSDAAKGLLAQGLRTPSLGTWQLFSRVLFCELQLSAYGWMTEEMQLEFILSDNELYSQLQNGKIDFPTLDKEKLLLLKSERKKRKSNFDEVIALRNGYAHGATPSDTQCETDLKNFEPFLDQLLELQWLKNSALEVREGKVYITTENEAISLHPILLFRKEDSEASYAFFNDLKNDKIGLLNYPLGKHYREKDFYDEFHEYLPLHEWKKTGNNEFFQRIEELTDTFKGRIQEREKLMRFVRDNHKGYFSIQGNPGIGKSALIAQFFKDLRAQEDMAHVQVVEYFIRRGTVQAQTEYMFNYLIRRTDELFAPGKEIRAEGRNVFDLQQQLFGKWRMWGEQRAGKKLLFLIDGLDEGTENNVATYMPRENFEGVLIIYGSRPGGHKTVEELWTHLPTEYHTKLELAGLGREDIRALIYEVANKYEVERESAWINAVQQRSQGNPLYLKLLCDALENGSIALNDIHALPDKIDEYYKAILDRYAADTVDGDALLAGLFTFAAARDYLTMAHLGLINKLGDALIQRIRSTLTEVVYENPLTAGVLDYQLFHESFREYLVKEKALKVKDALERIIDFCATWRELEGTWEQRYALQHYAAHAFESKREARSTELLALLGDTTYADTQKKVLKQFDATKELFRLCLLKASELKQYNHQLSAALSMVDLKYEEANDAPQVVALVAAGDIDLALKRIESFGGADKEGVKRRFTLYMLCLMELTLLESKAKPFRKAAIEKLLNHLDEQIPPDASIINWNDFFPSYTMFLMACDWSALGLDYRMVYKRTDVWKKDWLSEKGPYNDLQFEVLITCARGISDDFWKSSALRAISTELAKQGKVEEAASAMQEALNCARGISDDDWETSIALKAISTELAKQGKVEEASSAMQEALTCARGISDDEDKSSALKDISTELAKQGKIEESASAMQEALTCARGISDERQKNLALSYISTELAKQGKVEEASSAMQEALTCARGISDDEDKSSALKDISTELAKQGKVEESASAMQEALTCARGISDERRKSSALEAISTELAKQGKVEEAASAMQEALTCAMGISDERRKSSALRAISTELAKQGKVEEAASAMQEALNCARGISDDDWETSIALKAISTELAKQGKVEEASSAMQEALTCARGISDDEDKSSALKDISTELAKQGKVEESASAMQEALTCARGISDDFWKSSALKDISTELAKLGKFDEALNCARGISSYKVKIRALKYISTELSKQRKVEEAASAMQEALTCARGISNEVRMSKELKDISTELSKQGRFDEALTCARGISRDYFKSEALSAISTELSKQGKVEEAASAIQEALTCERGIRYDTYKSSALKDIYTELYNLGKYEEALACARGVSDNWKRHALNAISTELAKLGKFEEAASAMQEALTCARGISDDSSKSSALSAISTELAKQGKVEEAASAMQEALTCAMGISDDSEKSSALSAISTELAKQGKVEEAASAMQEALTCARGISDDYWKSSALKDISTELAKQGKVEEAASAMQEALTCTRVISNDRAKIMALKDISTELAKQGKVEEAASAMQEALTCTRGISSESQKRRTLKDISTELAKLGKFDEALNCARGISDESDKSIALSAISTELAKQGKVEEAASAMQEALNCASGISDDDWKKSRALSDISTEKAKQGDWALAETTSLEIPQLAERQNCWKKMPINCYKENGWQKALQQVNQLQSDEARIFYLKGWASIIKAPDADAHCVQEALSHLAHDAESVERLLQKHALREVFFGQADPENINQLNRSLNIQWALDTKAKFPQKESNARHSTNLDEWLHEIDDEDDKEDILGWADKVSSGKMTEEKFAERVRGK